MFGLIILFVVISSPGAFALMRSSIRPLRLATPPTHVTRSLFLFRNTDPFTFKIGYASGAKSQIVSSTSGSIDTDSSTGRVSGRISTSHGEVQTFRLTTESGIEDVQLRNSLDSSVKVADGDLISMVFTDGSRGPVLVRNHTTGAVKGGGDLGLNNPKGGCFGQLFVLVGAILWFLIAVPVAFIGRARVESRFEREELPRLQEYVDGLVADFVKKAPKPAGLKSEGSALSMSEELRSLTDLHAAGSLTDEQFEAAKTRLLGGN